MTSTPPPRANVGFLIQSSSHRTSGSSPATGGGTPGNKKQRQSQLKTIVHQFGDLIMNWQECSGVIEQSISSIISLVSNMRSIENTCRKNDDWIEKVMGPCPLFPSFESHPHYPAALMHDMNACPFMSKVDPNNSEGFGHEWVDFKDLENLLNSSILVDVEQMRIQIKSHMKRLTDIVLAMRLKSDEANKFIIGQPLDFFDAGAIFHTDHIIDIMNLCQMYQLEYDRKYMLIENIFTYDERATPLTSNEYFVLLENMSRDWNDDSRNSMVDSDQVDAYIIRNNIGPQNES